MPEVIRDIDCDPNNEAIILDILCADQTVNVSDEVKNEKVSTCKACIISFLRPGYRKMMENAEREADFADLAKPEQPSDN